MYQNTVRQMDENYNQRTCLAYVANQVRQHDAAGRVYLSEITRPARFDSGGWGLGWPVLHRHLLCMRVPCGSCTLHQGQRPHCRRRGQELLPLTAFSMREEDSLLRVEAIGPRGRVGLTLSLRSYRRGEGPMKTKNKSSLFLMGLIVAIFFLRPHRRQSISASLWEPTKPAAEAWI